MVPNRFALALAVAAATSFSPVASAASVAYSLTDCLTGCSGTQASIATLTLTEINNGVSFELTSTSAGSSFISGLYFNGVIGALDWDASGEAYKTFGYYSKPTATLDSAAGYNWDFTFVTTKSGDRFLSGDQAKWTITGNGVDLADFTANPKMMVHVQGVEGIPGVTSQKFSAVAQVPEPGSYAMLIAGLGLIGSVVRRRVRQG